MDPTLIAGLVINLVALGAAWGDMRRHVSDDRKVQAERYKDTTDRLLQIASDVKRINGTVIRHDAELATHEREIQRLRDAAGN